MDEFGDSVTQRTGHSERAQLENLPNSPILNRSGSQVALPELPELAELAELDPLPDPEAMVPGRTDWTWMACLSYQVFHVGYHTGQAFSVRHLMGHTTNDN